MKLQEVSLCTQEEEKKKDNRKYYFFWVGNFLIFFSFFIFFITFVTTGWFKKMDNPEFSKLKKDISETDFFFLNMN